MGSAKQNRLIARIIVGAITSDGELDKREKEQAVTALSALGMDELIADFGIALEEDDMTFNVYKECQELIDSLGSNANEVAPLVFRIIAEVVASDRYVTISEATYLSGVAKRLHIPTKTAQQMLKEVVAKTKGRLEISGDSVSADVNAHLKELLSFEGASDLVGELDSDSLQEMIYGARDAVQEGEKVSIDDVERSLAVLGLSGNAKLEDAEAVWRETINNLNLTKLADLGETFVSAAIQRIQTINSAYKVVLQFYKATAKK